MALIYDSTFNFYHPTLNSILTGNVVQSGWVVQYRGIKYASIPARFEKSILKESYPPTLDCTKDGPICPQPPSKPLETWLFNIPADQYGNEQIDFDEFECLNLVVVTPSPILGLQPREGPWPVYVHIHGGGNQMGSSSEKLIDAAGLVAHSVFIGKPIIVVSMNYRLHLLGFGVLPDGTGANNGLFDQRTALQWVHRHIGGFNGDPTHVTVGGESAGSCAVDAHLYANGSEEKPELQLFKRAVMMSGVIMTLPPEDVNHRIEVTTKYAEKIKGEGNAIEKLKNCDVNDLVNAVVALSPSTFPPAIDGDFLSKDFQPYAKSVPSWCEGILTGDCYNEAFLWSLGVERCSRNDILGKFKALNSDATWFFITQAYNLWTCDDGSVYKNTLDFITDALFAFVHHRTLTTWQAHGGKHTHQYIFDQPNPWDPRGHGAHHGVDLLYLFRNYSFPHEQDVELAERVQDDFITFYTIPAEQLDLKLGWKGGSETRAYGRGGSVSVVNKKQLRDRRRMSILEDIFEKRLGDEEVSRAVWSVMKLFTWLP